MIINGKEEKLQLEYPCNWEYKIFCFADVEINPVVTEVVKNRDFTLKKGNKSKTGKYQSYNVTLLVHNDDDRVELFALFKQHEQISMVL